MPRVVPVVPSLMRRLSLLITVLVVALLAPAGSAVASHGQVTSFEAPRDLLDPASREGAFNDIASFGVHSLRLVMYWRDVAPAASSRVKPKFDATDPSAYDWSRYQPVLDEAKARGWNVLLTLSGPVPRWATNGARDTVTRPSPNEFRMFVEAVAQALRRRGDDVLDLERAQPPGVPAPAVLGAPPARSRRGSTATSTSRRSAGFADAGSKRPCSSARPRRAAPARSSRR